MSAERVRSACTLTCTDDGLEAARLAKVPKPVSDPEQATLTIDHNSLGPQRISLEMQPE